MVKKIATGFLAVLLFMFAGFAMNQVYAWAKNTDNDVVLNQKQYVEYFKNEGHTKNYLYTKTEIPAPPPGKCVVVTGASERTMTMFCNTNAS